MLIDQWRLSRPGHEPAPASWPQAEQARLRHLFDRQKYAVLATDNNGQPYTSLMAFSAASDLRSFVLMTERDRLKYQNLMFNPHAAIMIDNRENLGRDLDAAVAVTALGVAREIIGENCADARTLFLARHPDLQAFADSPLCALIRIDVTSYVVVQQFQRVSEWQLAPPQQNKHVQERRKLRRASISASLGAENRKQYINR